MQHVRASMTNLPALSTSRSLLMHPLMIATAVWGGLLALYSLHLSALLIFTTIELLPLTFAIWVPFALVALGFSVWRPRILRVPYRVCRPNPARLLLIERRLKLLWRVWMCAAVFETVVSGGLPFVWLFTNSSKVYFDYGVPSLHGLVNSLLLAISLCRFLLYLLTGERRHLRVPALCVIWFILLVTRGSVFFLGIECAILFIRIRPFRTALLAKFAVTVLCVVLAFGWLGDIRSGAETFRDLAQPTDSYPTWLPSGILWVYIYATTPLNNLYYSLQSIKPEQNPLLPHTLSTLLPTVIKNVVYGDASLAAEALTGELIEANFNVSTAYLGPAQDFGLGAIFFFSLATASACQWYWYKPDLRSQLIFAVLGHCLVLSLFNDLFLYLPIIFQVVWFFFIFRKSSTHSSEQRMRRLRLAQSVQGLT